MSDLHDAHARLVAVVNRVLPEAQSRLKELKQNATDIDRPDFLWHYLLQSFATMGRAAGWDGLIGNADNYRLVTYEALSRLSNGDRVEQVRETCRRAKIRMPDKKADYILGCYDRVRELGGIESARATLLDQPGREGKLRFLVEFPGIGPKYARNIMMDVYHPDFHDSIAIDARIKSVSAELGLEISDYRDHERFYLGVAEDCGLNGWELDRLLFNCLTRVRTLLARDASGEAASGSPPPGGEGWGGGTPRVHG